MSSSATPFQVWVLYGFFATALPTATAALDLNGTIVLLDFNSVNGSGFAPNPAPGQLDSDDWAITGFSDGDLAFGGTAVVGDYARGQSTGNVVTGGVYAFLVGAGDSSLGVQPSGSDFTPGTITLRLRNITGSPIDELVVEYLVWTLNNEDFSTSVSFSHSADNVTYTPVPEMDFQTPGPADANPAWTILQRQTSLGGLNLQDGDDYYLRWASDDASGIGSRDEIALDAIEIVADNGIFRDGFEAGDTADWSVTVP